jgi:hypothetical protein
MISNITGAEQSSDDEDSSEVLINVENLPVSSVLQLNQNLNLVLHQKHTFCFFSAFLR